MVRNEVVMTALKGAAIKLGGLREGRKSIIFVSEGFTSILPPQLNDPVASLPGLGNSARNSPTAQNSDRAEWGAQVDMISDLSLIFTEMNRNNTSIYAVDPRGLAPFEYDINQGVGLQVDKKHLNSSLDTLRALAENTDGRAIVNRNDIGKGMQQIIRDASGYYLIGYNSTQAPTDGKFHEINVRGHAQGRRGAASQGLLGVHRRRCGKRRSAARRSACRRHGGAGDARRAAARPPGAFLDWHRKSETTASRGDVRVGAGCAGARRAAHGRRQRRERHADGAFPGRPAALPRTSSRAKRCGCAANEPGRRCRSRERLVRCSAWARAVANNGAERRRSGHGLLDQEVTVPDYTKPQVSFGTPRLYRARTPREVQAIKANPSAVPAAERSFSRTERLFVRVDAYAPGTVPPTSPPASSTARARRCSTCQFRCQAVTGEMEVALPRSPPVTTCSS